MVKKRPSTGRRLYLDKVSRNQIFFLVIITKSQSLCYHFEQDLICFCCCSRFELLILCPL